MNYIINGKVYASLKAVSRDYPEIPYNLLLKRKRQRLSGLELVSPPSPKKEPVAIIKGKAYSTFTEIAREFNISIDVIRENHRRGKINEELLITRTRVSFGKQINYIGSTDMNDTDVIYHAVYNGETKLSYVGKTSDPKGLHNRWSRHAYMGKSLLDGKYKKYMEYRALNVSYVDIMAAVTKPSDWDVEVLSHYTSYDPAMENKYIFDQFQNFSREQILNVKFNFMPNLTLSEITKLEANYHLASDARGEMNYRRTHPTWEPLQDNYRQELIQLSRNRDILMERNNNKTEISKKFREHSNQLRVKYGGNPYSETVWGRQNFVDNQLSIIDGAVQKYVEALAMYAPIEANLIEKHLGWSD